MNAAQAAKQAAKQSKNGQAFVVWVSDEGRAVYSGEQMKVWQAFVSVESAYVNGVQVSA